MRLYGGTVVPSPRVNFLSYSAGRTQPTDREEAEYLAAHNMGTIFGPVPVPAGLATACLATVASVASVVAVTGDTTTKADAAHTTTEGGGATAAHTTKPGGVELRFHTALYRLQAFFRGAYVRHGHHHRVNAASMISAWLPRQIVARRYQRRVRRTTATATIRAWLCHCVAHRRLRHCLATLQRRHDNK